MADESVSTNDLEDPDKARLVAQVDVANNITRLINYEFNSLIGQDVPVVKVDGENQGIRHSFKIDQDLFSNDDSRLINHKTYYFMVIAYAYNQYGDGFGNLEFIDGVYDPSSGRLEGQKLPYLASRKSATGPVKVYEAIPHKTDMEFGGIQLNAQYGDGVPLRRIEGRGNGGVNVDIKEDYLDSLMAAESSVDFWGAQVLDHEAGSGPVDVMVVDPLMIKPGKFTIQFIDSSSNKFYPHMTWVLYERDNTTDPIDTVKADQTVIQGSEQIVPELGLSITSVYGIGANTRINSEGEEFTSVTNGYLGFDIVYTDETDEWLSGIVDEDADPIENWIKSGTSITPEAEEEAAADDVFLDAAQERPVDGEQKWENIAGRTWAPFGLASFDTAHPIPLFGFLSPTAGSNFAKAIQLNAGLDNTPSVNVYLTTDKSKWTRCPVFEAGENAKLTEGGVVRGELRRALSVDKEGRNQLDPDVNADEATMNGSQVIGDMLGDMRSSDVDYFNELLDGTKVGIRAASFGMGWFPGYAVDVNTGERLNMAFSENSWLGSENGDDMIWNPTSKLREFLFNELRFGGMHMIYVFRNNLEDGRDARGSEYLMPSYDGGDFAFGNLATWDPTVNQNLINFNLPAYKRYMSVMRAGAWVGYPVVAEDHELWGASGENDVVIKLRSVQPYAPYAANVDEAISPKLIEAGESYYIAHGRVTVIQENDVEPGDTLTPATDTVQFFKGTAFTAVEDGAVSFSKNDPLVLPTINKGLPLYNFNTFDIAPTLDGTIGEDALDEIKAVPNPYYAYSSYEQQRLDYLVKIINLPQTCTVNIFTVNGTLVRTYEKDDATVTSIDWDLKNQDDITIASGLYVIHIEAPGIGEKVIKWFGVLRPIDLNSF